MFSAQTAPFRPSVTSGRNLWRRARKAGSGSLFLQPRDILSLSLVRCVAFSVCIFGHSLSVLCHTHSLSLNINIYYIITPSQNLEDVYIRRKTKSQDHGRKE